MVEAMEAIYCASIGAEYMHIVDTKKNAGFNSALKVRAVNSTSQLSKKTFLGAFNCR
jgi:2-oxoglutarate dehydrogenase E1 component